ncbi:MAG: DUF502 domain-containing protein [Pirellulales bacterium]
MNEQPALPAPAPPTPRPTRPFRQAVLNGLAVILPPLLTVVIFLWVWGTLNDYVLTYIETGARNVLVYFLEDIRSPEDLQPPADQPPYPDKAAIDGKPYRRVGENQYVPLYVYEEVAKWEEPPNSARPLYHEYVRLEYLKPQIVVPVFLCVFILLMYALGKLLGGGVGRFFWDLFERGILRLPMVRSVYSSVKQVTEFMLSKHELEVTRVVAVEYPRRGIWSLGFVMGDGMYEIAAIAGEPVLSVLLPTSPMPMTGYVVLFRRSEVLDLDLSIEEALQYLVSCGVVVAPQQLLTPENLAKLRARASAAFDEENAGPVITAAPAKAVSSAVERRGG